MEAEVMKLGANNRGELALKTPLTLEETDETEVVQLWVAKAESRLKEVWG